MVRSLLRYRNLGVGDELGVKRLLPYGSMPSPRAQCLPGPPVLRQVSGFLREQNTRGLAGWGDAEWWAGRVCGRECKLGAESGEGLLRRREARQSHLYRSGSSLRARAQLAFGAPWALPIGASDPHPLDARGTPSCDNQRCTQMPPSVLEGQNHPQMRPLM